MHRIIAIALCAVALTACATTSDVMDMGDGTYTISAHASAVRGGTTGANRIAYAEAQNFCAAQGRRVIVVNASERDQRVTGVSGNWNNQGGSVVGVTAFGGNVNLRFRCEA